MKAPAKFAKLMRAADRRFCSLGVHKKHERFELLRLLNTGMVVMVRNGRISAYPLHAQWQWALKFDEELTASPTLHGDWKQVSIDDVIDAIPDYSSELFEPTDSWLKNVKTGPWEPEKPTKRKKKK